MVKKVVLRQTFFYDAVVLVSDISPWLVRIAAFVLGAVWGSFFNVAIYRWPRGMSVVHPPSHCPHCGAPVPFFRNVPIVGFLLLRGKAACCGAKLTPRYVVVEILAALLFVAVAERFILAREPEMLFSSGALETVIYCTFVSGLLIATFVDLEWMEIPDEVSLPGAALGLATATLRSEPGVEEAALGAGGGFLIVQVLFVWMYERLLGRRGMGEGDSKLLLMIGAFIGYKGVLFCLVAGAVQGIVAAAVLLLSGKPLTPVRPDQAPITQATEPINSIEASTETPEPTHLLKLPFGPFLALGALEFLFVGESVLAWYSDLLGAQ